MLYLNTLKINKNSVQEAIVELFDKAFQNQSHPQDLLLIIENGFYSDEFVNSKIRPKLSPYLIGPGIEGYAAETQFKFYDSYRKHIITEKETFIQNAKNEIEKYHLIQENSIQIELMIYLKFWEAEQIVKQLYQLSRLARGIEYDWHFNIEQFDKGRQGIIRELVRDPLEKICSRFFQLLKKIYNNQIRNAIAHSQFAILGNNITLTNRHLSKHYKLDYLSFEEWEDIIHQVILMYDEIIAQINRYTDIYIKKSLPMHNGLLLRMTRPDKSTNSEFYIYEKASQRWTWYNNLNK